MIENKTQIEAVCAWCKKHMGIRESGTLPAIITHGMCDDCKNRMITDLTNETELLKSVRDVTTS